MWWETPPAPKTIKVPADEGLRNRLAKKRDEYNSRVTNGSQSARADARPKMLVLDAVLAADAGTRIEVESLREKARVELGGEYDDQTFDNAAGVIATYAGDAPPNTELLGGHGLPT